MEASPFSPGRAERRRCFFAARAPAPSLAGWGAAREHRRGRARNIMGSGARHSGSGANAVTAGCCAASIMMSGVVVCRARAGIPGIRTQSRIPPQQQGMRRPPLPRAKNGIPPHGNPVFPSINLLSFAFPGFTRGGGCAGRPDRRDILRRRQAPSSLRSCGPRAAVTPPPYRSLKSRSA